LANSSADGEPDTMSTPTPYYKYHVFLCTNVREEGRQCCGQCGAQASRDYLKQRTKELGLAGPGGVRVNNAGCLDRCSEGPVAVVYPEGTWYTYVDSEDLEEILQSHLIGGEVVERLRLPG
jgi:(2Fe-2S) ferredoxin